ncbi:hypothetical protein N7452_009982 [Penicillium brevicompactum]|uniref:Aminoglycoside phosphotransferase domain-containing protein n=1 Tax=Penicillium brevicompactum TaxID=5074 RepID=A0A9W9Q9C0_PENBR|nr:hypothetical protein N7452_009982 [Penicillium brevicompactum]
MGSTLSEEELARRMRQLVRAGLLGNYDGKATISDIIEQDEKTITFLAALYDMTSEEIDENHLICITKEEGALVSKRLVTINQEELDGVFHNLGLGSPDQITRLSKGFYGVTYQVSVKEKEENFIVQLRYHGNVDSMDTLMRYIHDNVAPTLPVAIAYPTSLQVLDVFKVQITQFVPGIPGNEIFYNLPLPARIEAVKQIARAFAPLWNLQIDQPHGIIGEVNVSDNPVSVSIGPERRYGLGGPFSSTSQYLEAWLHHCIRELESTDCVEEFQENILPAIRKFMNGNLNIPPQVEEVPVVILHDDLALNNMIFSSDDPHDLQAIIDWELVDNKPFAVAIPKFIEPLFWADSKGDQKDHDGYRDLRKAFWDAIPRWKAYMNSEATRVFLDWYNLGDDLKVLPPFDDDLSAEQKLEFWKDNIRAVWDFLGRYGDASGHL